MASLRCSTCGLDWPPNPDLYRTCPGCENLTDRVDNERPMEAEHASSLRNQLNFERWYGAYCERLGQTVNGDILPLPAPVCGD